jgi:hypothetical protein
MRYLIHKYFVAHVQDVGETYFQHARCALTVSFKLASASIFQLLHAIVPGIHPPYGTDLKSLAEFCDKRLPERRRKDNEPR